MKYFINCSHYRTITVTTSLLRGSVAKNKNEDRRKGRIETLLGFSFGKWWWWMVIFCVFFCYSRSTTWSRRSTWRFASARARRSCWPPVSTRVRPSRRPRRCTSPTSAWPSTPTSCRPVLLPFPNWGRDPTVLGSRPPRMLVTSRTFWGPLWRGSLSGVATPHSWGCDPLGRWWRRILFADRSDLIP